MSLSVSESTTRLTTLFLFRLRLFSSTQIHLEVINIFKYVKPIAYFDMVSIGQCAGYMKLRLMFWRFFNYPIYIIIIIYSFGIAPHP